MSPVHPRLSPRRTGGPRCPTIRATHLGGTHTMCRHWKASALAQWDICRARTAIRRSEPGGTPENASCWFESCQPFTICACSSEGRCVGKSHLEQARLATGSTAKLALSFKTSTSHENRRSGIRSGGLLHERIVVRGRIAPSAATIVEAGGEQLRESSGRPRGRPAPEAPRSPCTGSRSR